MSGLLRRLTRRRAATADEPRPSAPETSDPDAAPAETPAEAGGQPPVDASEQPTRMIPATGQAGPDASSTPAREYAAPGAPAEPDAAATAAHPAPAEPDAAATAAQPAPADAAARAQPAASETGARDLPAGVDPGELEVAPAPSARRGKLRRRLRYLRRVRELLLRDLGGFTYEVHRTAGGSPRESHRRLAEAKASRLAALDAEVRELEARLSEPHEQPVMREPGIGGTCPECGALHASDAHYCSRCGEPLDAKARSAREAAIRAAAQPTTGTHPTPEPKPASVLWAAGPRPRAETSKAEAGEAAQPKTSMATSEWLAAPSRGADEPKPTGDAPSTEAPTAAPGDEPMAGTHEPADVAKDEPGVADEAAAALDEPAAAGGEPAKAAVDEPAAGAGDETAADDAPAGGADEKPAAEAKPKAPRRRRSKKAEEAPAEAGPNGRRDEDVPPPVTSGDPLGSPGKRRP